MSDDAYLRDYDHHAGINRSKIENVVELELVTGSAVEDIFLHRGFQWRDFYAPWAHGKIVWISPDVFFDMGAIDSNDFQTDYRSFLVVKFEANEGNTSKSQIAFTFAPVQRHTQPLPLTFYFSFWQHASLLRRSICLILMVITFRSRGLLFRISW
jgi:hypothetical protein